jgi:hypothetical protein
MATRSATAGPPTGEDRITRNSDIEVLCRKLKKYAYEFHKSVSSALAGIREADRTRMGQMIDDLRALKAHIVAQPEIDAPKSSPRDIHLEGFDRGEMPLVENDVVNIIVDSLYVCWVEMATGQSTNLPNGIYSPDQVRFDQQIDKCSHLLTDYSDVIQPLDLPESNPKFESSGEGRHGPN